MKPGAVGYTDEVMEPGQEVYCRCWHAYIYNLKSVPDDMLTAKGRDEIKRMSNGHV